MCKRASRLEFDLKALPNKGAINIVIDSTGLKVYGEGEWKVRVHGKARRRTWKKLHLAVNPDTHEIVGCELTDHKTHLASRKAANEEAEARLKAQILNCLTHLGMPQSYIKS